MERILQDARLEHKRQLEEIKMATRNVTEINASSLEDSKQVNSRNSSRYTTASGWYLHVYFRIH